MPKKLAIVVGHTAKSPGARAALPIDQHEYEWNKDLAQRMAKAAATARGAPDVAVEIFLRDRVGIAGAYANAKAWGADGAMELHFNAATPAASGTETLFHTDVSRWLAEAVHGATLRALGLRDRGVKTPAQASGGRGERNLSQMGARPSILTEPFFGSNPGDAAIAHECKDALAAAQVSAALDYLLEPVDGELGRPPTSA